MTIDEVVNKMLEDISLGESVSKKDKLSAVLNSIENDNLREAVQDAWGSGKFTPMPTDDFGQILIHSQESMSTPTVYRDGCYICEDPEYSMMGLPLCYKCPECSGHIPADDTLCDDCGYDMMDSKGEMDCG